MKYYLEASMDSPSVIFSRDRVIFMKQLLIHHIICSFVVSIPLLLLGDRVRFPVQKQLVAFVTEATLFKHISS